MVQTQRWTNRNRNAQALVQVSDNKQYQECGSAEKLGHLLDTQSREIDRCMELLQRRKAMLTSVLEENRSFQRYGGRGFQVLEWKDMWFSRLLPEDRKPPFVVNYLTDGLQIGLFIGVGEQFLYQKRTDGEICAPGGKYLCLYDLSATAVQEWLTDTTEAMNRYAAENSFRLDGCFTWNSMTSLLSKMKVSSCSLG